MSYHRDLTYHMTIIIVCLLIVSLLIVSLIIVTLIIVSLIIDLLYSISYYNIPYYSTSQPSQYLTYHIVPIITVSCIFLQHLPTYLI